MVKSILRFALKAGMVSLLAFGTYKFCTHKTAGFRIQRIQSSLSFDPRWVTRPLYPDEEKELFAILNQPFSYLGKGAQCYVFESQDKKHVIKFFRVHHIEMPPWMTMIPLPKKLDRWREEKRALKEAKRAKDFTSYKIAFEEMKEESGLLYLHLNKTEGLLNRSITLVDKLGISHRLDLDAMEFMVQKKATLFYPTLESWLESGQREKVRNGIHELIVLFQKRRSLDISDKDPDLKTNFGFINEHLVEFDMGRLKHHGYQEKQESLKNETLRITDELKRWLIARDPDLAKQLESEILSL